MLRVHVTCACYVCMLRVHVTCACYVCATPHSPSPRKHTALFIAACRWWSSSEWLVSEQYPCTHTTHCSHTLTTPCLPVGYNQSTTCTSRGIASSVSMVYFTPSQMVYHIDRVHYTCLPPDSSLLHWQSNIVRNTTNF